MMQSHDKFYGCRAIARLRITWLLLLALLVGCSSGGLKKDIAANPTDFAQAPATEGILAEISKTIRAEHGADLSGFRVLDSSYSGLHWRLALIDSAVSSLDIQTYLWYPDYSGTILLERALLAAQRGVKVRLIVDDLILQGHDQLIANMQAQPNIEFRLFNPWENRSSMATRAGEMLAQMERLNTRMHDKLLIADGRAAVVGGRNIGDHYFGLSDAYNFHDTDLLGIGYFGGQANTMFDTFWNGEWVVSAKELTTEPNTDVAQQQWENVQKKVAEASELSAFPRQPQDWAEELEELVPTLRIGKSKFIFDAASDDHIDQNVISGMFNFFGMAKKELLIMNAYVIPSQPAIDFLQSLHDKGVQVKILTNSLSSHDVPAVNSHYEPWRDDLLEAGVELYELRSDPAIKETVVEVPPMTGEFTGLHSKTAVVDRRYVFIGSMNLDPRSAAINTEMGAFVDSPELAQDMARIIERDMSKENAWHVQLDKEGNIFWQNSEETLTSQPARDGTQRVMNLLMKLGPKDQF